MQLRNYCAADLGAIEKINSFCAVSIKYHGDIKEENILCVVDENEKLIGAGYLKFDERLRKKGKLVIGFSTSIEEAHQGNMDAEGMLTDGLINRFHEIRRTVSYGEVCLRTCCEPDGIRNMQLLIDKGFCLNSVIPVLKYDLSQETKHYDIPGDVRINEYAFTEENIKKYVHADSAASDMPESEADIRFKTGDPNFKCFAATCDSEFVGAISVWNITDKRAATENIFVVPSFRRKNLARELIAAAFDELKGRGMEIATLSMSGTNMPAMKLYLSCRYTLYYNLIEMLYDAGRR